MFAHDGRADIDKVRSGPPFHAAPPLPAGGFCSDPNDVCRCVAVSYDLLDGMSFDDIPGGPPFDEASPMLAGDCYREPDVVYRGVNIPGGPPFDEAPPMLAGDCYREPDDVCRGATLSYDLLDAMSFDDIPGGLSFDGAPPMPAGDFYREPDDDYRFDDIAGGLSFDGAPPMLAGDFYREPDDDVRGVTLDFLDDFSGDAILEGGKGDRLFGQDEVGFLNTFENTHLLADEVLSPSDKVPTVSLNSRLELTHEVVEAESASAAANRLLDVFSRQ